MSFDFYGFFVYFFTSEMMVLVRFFIYRVQYISKPS